MALARVPANVSYGRHRPPVTTTFKPCSTCPERALNLVTAGNLWLPAGHAFTTEVTASAALPEPGHVGVKVRQAM